MFKRRRILYNAFLQLTVYVHINKKFELMLTGRAKAYSSSCSQTVSLSQAILSQLFTGGTAL